MTFFLKHPLFVTPRQVLVSTSFTYPSPEWMPFQARSKHKMTGGAERVTHINSPPRFSPPVKAYVLVMSDHYICLQYLPGCFLIRIVFSTTPAIKLFLAYFRLVWISFSAALAKIHCKTFNINVQKPKFYSSTVVYFTLADLLGHQ